MRLFPSRLVRFRRAALPAAILAATTFFLGLPAIAGQPAVSAVAVPGVTTTTVTLITGDEVTVTRQPDGHSTYATRPAPGGSTAFREFQNASGDKTVVPVIALPFLGRQLDPSLFDVSALVRDGIDGQARIPVSLTFAAGVKPTAPPGVTLTSIGTSSATGYVGASTTTAFAAALRAQSGADVAAGRPVGSGSMFGGVTGLTLAAATSPPTTPYYDLHDLLLDATYSGSTTSPAVADVVLLNTDDLSRGQIIFPIVDGAARIAVPAGNYSANVLFTDYDSQGNATTLKVVTLDDFGVSGNAPSTTVTLAESSATSRISVTTPRAATQDLLDVDWYRQATAGQVFDASLFVAGTTPLYVTPQPAAQVGRLRYVVQWGGAGTGYRYDLAFGADQVAANQTYAVRSSDVAVVQQHFSADPAAGTHGSLLDGAVDPISTTAYNLYGGTAGQVMPGDLTQYLGGGDGGRWAQEVASPPNGPTAATLVADPHDYAPGTTYSVNWAHGPLAPAFGTHVGAQECLACMAGGTLSLLFDRAHDSEADHVGSFYAGTDHLTLYQNGTQVYDSGGASGVELTNVPAVAATFRAVLHTDISGVSGFSQSTITDTDLTTHYVPGGGNALPAEDACLGESANAPCAILPALTLTYDLASDETNTSNTATQSMGLTVGHVSYDGAGSTSPIASATVSVSFDNGTTWLPATVTGTNGTYTASWSNPAGATPVLRTTATDADGNSITQTVSHAYTIGVQAATDVCGPAAAGRARCFAEIRPDSHGLRAAGAIPAGYGPSDLASAYALPSTGGANQTVAVVDAGDDPNAESDLAVYRSAYGLPACTTANGCFRKVNQSGTASPLPSDFGWAPEISLDLDMVSAVCPGCHILLVESNDPLMNNMGASVDTAVGLGATEVSNSYGAAEQNDMTPVIPDYQHPGVAIVASSGDTGFGVPNFPADLTSVVAVGGTSLSRASNTRGWTESVWSNGSSGCSAWVAKPSWQTDPHCPGRTVGDVAAVADPNTGVAVYDTYNGEPGWLVAGGTSAASPVIAGIIALAGNPARYPDASCLYAHTSQLNDVTSGDNVTTTDCGGDYLCNGGPGYDAPTGNGTPAGIGAF
jgi:hypothetical protein